MNNLEALRQSIRENAPNDLARAVLQRTDQGVTLSLEVSPCSWMYPTYGLQVTVRIEGGGNIHVHDKTVLFQDATVDDLNRLFDTVRLKPCKRCGTLTFDPESVSTNREGLCEECFLGDLRKDIDKAAERDAKRQRAADAKKRAAGYTHRVNAWVHPDAGEDFQIVMYAVNPTVEIIEQQLKRRRSTVLNDYVITALDS